MNARFTPPAPSPDGTLIGAADSLIVSVLAASLNADAVDLDDDSACRTAVLASGQTLGFTEEYLSTIRLAAWQQRGASQQGST